MSSILLKRIQAKDDTFSIFSENNAVSLNVKNLGIEIGGATSISGGLAVAGGSLTMNNGTSNFLLFPPTGVASPSLVSRSIGTRLVMYPTNDDTMADFAWGMGTGAMWYSVGDMGNVFRFYHGTTNTLDIRGTSLDVLQTTASTSTTTGALRVSGGAGIVGNAYIGGLTRMTNSTASTSASTGALTVAGGVGISGNLNVASKIYVGPVGGVGTIYLGGGDPDDADYDMSVIETRSYASGRSEMVLFKGNDGPGSDGPDRIRLRAAAIAFDTYSSASTDRTAENIRMLINSSGQVGIGTTTPGVLLDVAGTSRFTGVAQITNTTVSTSASTGALTVAGGVGIAGNLNVAGSFDGVDSSPAIPGITGLTNVTTVIGLTSNLVKLGNSRTLYATFEVAPAAANIKTLFTFDVPGLSVLSQKYTLVGSIQGYDSSETALNNMNLIGDPATGKAKIQFTARGVDAHIIQINVTYPYFMGRYVIFGQFDGKTERLDLKEMEVYDENNVNIASQSTPSCNAGIFSGSVANLIDGNLSTEVVSAFTANVRYTLDFGKEVRISRIVIVDGVAADRSVSARTAVRDNLSNNVYYSAQILAQLTEYSYDFENHPVQEF